MCWDPGHLQAGPARAARKVLSMWAGCVSLHQALCLLVRKDVCVHPCTCTGMGMRWGWDGEGAHVPHAWGAEVVSALAGLWGGWRRARDGLRACTPSTLISCAEILAGTQRSHRAAC